MVKFLYYLLMLRNEMQIIESNQVQRILEKITTNDFKLIKIIVHCQLSFDG
jgi:protein-tyrosine phosphatase